MAAGSVVPFLLGLLLLVAVVTLVLAARHRLAFRIALRNVRRGRARTALLIAGLLVGTTIIAGSLIVGDTVQQLSFHYTYLGAGYVDEAILGPGPTGGLRYFPVSVFDQVSANLSGYGSVVGIAPMIVDGAAVRDTASGIPETGLNLIGVNGGQSGALGSFLSDNGTAIAGPTAGGALIDDQTAAAINATVGDTLVVYGRAAASLTIQAIVQENVRGAFITGGLSPGNVFVGLATAQALENANGSINYIALTNAGSQAAGAAASAGVSAYLNTTLAPILSANGLEVTTPLATGLDQATQSSQATLTIFLVLGLFSIVAGAMLIVGIFVMLAEERKGEMGMLRAIGMRRRELVYAYYFEGVTYAAGSALAGTALGVAVGYLLVYLAGLVLSGEGIPAGAIVQSFTVAPSSMVFAYVAGFLLTLGTVVVACRRASRLNIVRAIRDVPEPPPHLRTYTFLAYLGAAAVALGALGFAETYRGTTDISEPVLTGALAIVGIALIAARFVRNRFVFTAMGAALLVWAGFEPLHTVAFGSTHTGGIFIVFVEGILMVTGALAVLLFNAPFWAALLRRLFGPRAARSPVVRVGLDYPTRQPTRTAVSLTIFSLVVFTMVATGTFGSTIQGNLDYAVQSQSGGYSLFGVSQTPIPGLWGAIQNNSTLRPLFAEAVTLATGTADVRVPGWSSDPFVDSVFAPPTTGGPNTSFYATNGFAFTATANGMDAAAVFARLATDPNATIVDQNYAPATAGVAGGGGPPHPTLGIGTTITVSAPHNASAANLTVVGILRESILAGVWLNPTTAAHLGYTAQNAYFLTVRSGVSTTHAAQEAKKAFFASGLVLFDLRGLLATSINTTEGFVGLLELFVGLGLGVGIAAMGILALRSVVERRRSIGMLRAIGFTRGMVLRAFVLEYTVVTLVGVAVGVGLGLLIVYNLSTSPSAAASGIRQLYVPTATVVEIAAIAYGLVLLAIAGPSQRAARLPPAEAVRGAE